MTFTKRILPFFTLALFFVSCKEESKDPNKHIDEGTVTGEVYESKEIGWTMEIPKGWNITSRDKLEASDKRGKEMMEKAGQVEISMDSLKHLISFQKDRFNNFGSTSEPVHETYPGEYKENSRNINALIYQTFTSQGIKCDTASGTETIAGKEFNTFYTTIYSKKGDVILNQVLYSQLINGFDFGVNINYNNEADRDTLMNAFKKSRFK